MSGAGDLQEVRILSKRVSAWTRRPCRCRRTILALKSERERFSHQGQHTVEAALPKTCRLQSVHPGQFRRPKFPAPTDCNLQFFDKGRVPRFVARVAAPRFLLRRFQNKFFQGSCFFVKPEQAVSPQRGDSS